MMEGYLTGIYVAQDLGMNHPNESELIKLYEEQLVMLRDGPFGIKTKVGLAKLREDGTHA